MGEESIRKLNPGIFKWDNIKNYLSIISIILVTSILTMLNPNFLSGENIKNILTDTAPLLAMAGGVTFVLFLGSIDLSTGAVCSFTCVVTGMYIGEIGNWIIPIVLLIGVFAGLVNGILFTKLKIPSFIVTLCTLSIWKCAALLLSGGAPYGIPVKKWDIIKWAKITFGDVPILFVIAMVVLLLYYVLQSRLIVGKTIFATGANERAASMMGLKLMPAKICAFVLSGVGSALAGIFYAIKLKSSLPSIGDSLNLMAIAAVALGGTALTGGKGSVLKTLLGAVLVIIIQNGLNVIGVDAFWQQIVFGLLVIYAIYMNADKSGSDVIVK